MGIADREALNPVAPSLVVMAAVQTIAAPGVAEVDQNALVGPMTDGVVADAALEVTGARSAGETDVGGKIVGPPAASETVATVRGEAGTTTVASVLVVSDRAMTVHVMGVRAGRIDAQARGHAQPAVVADRAGMRVMIGEILAATGAMTADPAETSAISGTVGVPLGGMRTRGFAMIDGVRGRSVVGSRMIGGVRASRVATSPIAVEDRGTTSVGTATLGPRIAVEAAGTTAMIVASAQAIDAMTVEAHVMTVEAHVMTVEAHAMTGLSLEIVAVGAARGMTAGSAVMIAAKNASFPRALSDAKTNRRYPR